MADIKNFLVRMPKDLWLFLKKYSAENEVSMIEVIIMLITKFKERKEGKKLDDR